MEQSSTENIKIDETYESIEVGFIEMHANCRNLCSPVKNASSREECESKCEENYMKQTLEFVIRKYSNLCGGKFFDEQWRHKVENREKAAGEVKTGKVIKFCRKSKEIFDCTERCIDQWSAKVGGWTKLVHLFSDAGESRVEGCRMVDLLGLDVEAVDD